MTRSKQWTKCEQIFVQTDSSEINQIHLQSNKFIYFFRGSPQVSASIVAHVNPI